jgi:hypothetical protein
VLSVKTKKDELSLVHQICSPMKSLASYKE